jgi:hypothetical protein
VSLGFGEEVAAAAGSITRPWSASQVGRGVAGEEKDGADQFQVIGAGGDGPRRR